MIRAFSNQPSNQPTNILQFQPVFDKQSHRCIFSALLTGLFAFFFFNIPLQSNNLTFLFVSFRPLSFILSPRLTSTDAKISQLSHNTPQILSATSASLCCLNSHPDSSFLSLSLTQSNLIVAARHFSIPFGILAVVLFSQLRLRSSPS